MKTLWWSCGPGHSCILRVYKDLSAAVLVLFEMCYIRQDMSIPSVAWNQLSSSDSTLMVSRFIDAIYVSSCSPTENSFGMMISSWLSSLIIAWADTLFMQVLIPLYRLC